MRLPALGLVAFAAALALLGTPAAPGSDVARPEAHHLLVAESVVSDGDLDVADEFARRAYAPFLAGVLEPSGRPTDGRLREPQGAGFGLLIAPAYAAGGVRAVQVALAAVLALAAMAAAALARRIVPEPWATAGAALVLLSPPALAAAAAVLPDLLAGTLIVAGALAAARARRGDRAGAAAALAGAGALAVVPWLGPQYLLPAAPVAMALVRWTRAAGRRVAGLLAGEAVIGSLLFWATLNDRLYGGLTPWAAATDPLGPTRASFPLGYVERAPRLLGALLDRDAGLLRWAPVLALPLLSAWLLWRSRRLALARALPQRREAEDVAALALWVCAAGLAVAALAAPSLGGDWFPGRHAAVALPAAAALAGWGLRHAPRAGAVLGALTLVASGWLVVALRTGALAGREPLPATDGPWGPLARVLPRWEEGSPWAAAVTGAIALAVAALAGREVLRARRTEAA